MDDPALIPLPGVPDEVVEEFRQGFLTAALPPGAIPICVIAAAPAGALATTIWPEAFDDPAMWGPAIAGMCEHVAQAAARKGADYAKTYERVVKAVISEMQVPKYPVEFVASGPVIGVGSIVRVSNTAQGDES